MTNTNANFSPPLIVGILSERPPPSPWLVTMRRHLRRIEKDVIALPFEVERRYLKNTLACMRLMDIACLIVRGKHRHSLIRYLPNLDPTARKMGCVDLVVRKGTKFMGMSLSPRGDSPLPSLLAHSLIPFLK